MPNQADAGAVYPPELARLPPGRHGLPKEFVAHNQRERLIAGLVEAVAENGYASTTIAHVTSHAAVSRRTFYEHFDSKDACFIAAYDAVVVELRGRVAAAYEGEDEWPLAIRAAIGAMLAFFCAEPCFAKLALVDTKAAGPLVTKRYDGASRILIPYLRQGRQPEVIRGLSDSTEEALVGGMSSLISRRIVSGAASELESLLSDFVEFSLTPYLGSQSAARIARASGN